MATAKVLASSTANSVQFTASNIGNAYTDATSTTYAQLTLSKKNSTSTIEFTGFDFSGIPSNATISSVTCNFKGMVNSTTYVSSATVQPSKNGTLVGSALSFRYTSATSRAVTMGSWTRSELDGLRLYISARAANNNNSKYIRVYGMDVTVTYVVPVVTDGMLVKQSGVWKTAAKVYRKAGGSWVEVTDLKSIDKSANYVMG